MFGYRDSEQQLKPFFLPSPLPQWPQGQGFATGVINLGELEVTMVKDFKLVYTYTKKKGGCGVSFYKPVSIPDGFFSLGHYCQPTHQHQLPTAGYVLVARNAKQETETNNNNPPLKLPLDYDLLLLSGNCLVWQPLPPLGYRAMGFVVKCYDSSTGKSACPNLEEIMCVREDLTENCDVVIDRKLLQTTGSEFLIVNPKTSSKTPGKGVTVGTSYVITLSNLDHVSNFCCLTNMNPDLEAMPNLEQADALLDHYRPTVYFHPDEVYLPSSVPWFFNNGGLVYKNGDDGFWLDLPPHEDTLVKHGNLESAQLYAIVKPALGGTFTDIDMWIFYQFNGPDTCTIFHLFNLNIQASKHVGGWERFTLRISNFDGQLWSMYFPDNTSGKWVNASSLEFIDGNKPIVYISKCRHTALPRAGTYIQGSTKLFGTGIKKVVDKSGMFIDASKKYLIVSAEYLGGAVAEPEWLRYMQELKATELYNERSKREEVSSHLSFFTRMTLRCLIHLFPVKVYVRKRRSGFKVEGQ